ncbi:MAG: hypothetical protein Q8R79_02890 [Legionellaceae bacterium]|nr:hypothetical protein [Legionellaceae bacterium]
MDFISHQELSTLIGLPHIQQVTYLLGIRPYMDDETLIVGIKRRISYQFLLEMLHIDSRPGLSPSNTPNKQQLRRIIKRLEQIGLIQIQSSKKYLILKCLLAHSAHSCKTAEFG